MGVLDSVQSSCFYYFHLFIGYRGETECYCIGIYIVGLTHQVLVVLR